MSDSAWPAGPCCGLRFDLDNERSTIANYRDRILQAESLGEFALGEMLRETILQEQEHAIDLADALGIDVPEPATEAASK